MNRELVDRLIGEIGTLSNGLYVVKRDLAKLFSDYPDGSVVFKDTAASIRRKEVPEWRLSIEFIDELLKYI